MKKLIKSIYLDTSVASAYFDENTPERRGLTIEFFAGLYNFTVSVSDLTIKELTDHPDEKFHKKALELIISFKKLSTDDDCNLLAEKYLEFGLFKPRDYADALHLAIASVNEIDYLISWNFKHMVNVKTRNLANLANINQGYSSIEIIAPPEL